MVYEGVPVGVIVMWSGLLSAIPGGWHLCDGTGGTPDLRGKFVKGSAAGVDPGVTGGGSYTPAGTVSAPTFTGSSATTSATSGGTPAGTISAPVFTGTPQTFTTGLIGIAVGTAMLTPNPYTPAGTVSAPTFTGSALSEHTHTLSATGTISAPTFTGTAASPEPTYYALAFIMRVS
jgi:hypothetical protein